MQRIVTLLFLSILPLFSIAQEATIEGRVLDGISDQPIEGVSVFIGCVYRE